MKTTFIYALKCPTTGLIRYVGKSDNPKKRFREHLTKNSKEVCWRARWIRSVLAQNLKPLLEIIDEVDDGVNEGLPLEAAYIEFFREEGFDLTNATPGGEGVSLPGEKHPHFGKRGTFFGHKHSPESLELQRSAKLGKKHSPEACTKMSISHIGEKNYMFGKTHSPEAVEKIKAVRATQINPMFGKKQTAEAKEKISMALKTSWAIKKASGALPTNCVRNPLV